MLAVSNSKREVFGHLFSGSHDGIVDDGVDCLGSRITEVIFVRVSIEVRGAVLKSQTKKAVYIAKLLGAGQLVTSAHPDMGR
jgi:hypothetical protein